MLELLRDTRVDLARSGARFGEGCFETVRLTRGRPWRLDLHHQRLTAGCTFLGLPAPPPMEALAQFLAHEALGAELDRAVLRLLAVDGTLRVWAEPAPAPVEGPVNLGLSGQVRRFSGNALNRFKTLNYAENRLLQREAEARGLFDVIAANERGELTDGGRFTLLLRQRGAWVTPALISGALPGVARAALLDSGLIHEQSLPSEALERPEGILLVNALRGMLCVGEFEGHGIPMFPPEALKSLVTVLASN